MGRECGHESVGNGWDLVLGGRGAVVDRHDDEAEAERTEQPPDAGGGERRQRRERLRRELVALRRLCAPEVVDHHPPVVQDGVRDAGCGRSPGRWKRARFADEEDSVVATGVIGSRRRRRGELLEVVAEGDRLRGPAAVRRADETGQQADEHTEADDQPERLAPAEAGPPDVVFERRDRTGAGECEAARDRHQQDAGLWQAERQRTAVVQHGEQTDPGGQRTGPRRPGEAPAPSEEWRRQHREVEPERERSEHGVSDAERREVEYPEVAGTGQLRVGDEAPAVRPEQLGRPRKVQEHGADDGEGGHRRPDEDAP